MGTSPSSRDTTTSNKRGRQVKVGKGFVRKIFLNTDMVASWIVSGSCLLILGLSSLSTLTNASPISAEKVDKRMDMGTNGFYGDTFDSGFGSFETAKRRYIPTSSIHNEDMLAQRPRRIPIHKRMPYIVHKRMDVGMNGFHGDTFSSGFGDFSTAKRKRIMSNSNGFYGDTFSDGFGDFSTAKKRSMGMNSFHGDTFSHGFGDFETV